MKYEIHTHIYIYIDIKVDVSTKFILMNYQRNKMHFCMYQ